MSDRWNPCKACKLGLYYDPEWCPKVCEYAKAIVERDEAEQILRIINTDLNKYFVFKEIEDKE